MLFPVIGKIATTDVVTIDINNSIENTIKKMFEHGHRNIIVLDSDNQYKILTVQDILNIRSREIDLKSSMRDLGLSNVPVLNKHENVLSTLEFLNCEIEYICVLNDDGSLFGLVTHTDIISSIDPDTLMDNFCLSDFLKLGRRAKWVGKSTSTSELLCDMAKNSFESVIVVEDLKPIGIFTTKDVIRLIEKNEDLEEPIAKYMSSPVESIHEDCSVKEALDFLKNKHYKRVVVVDENGRISGVISQKELIATTYSRWALLTKEYQNELKEINEALVNKNKRYEEIASKDPLTKLYNRYKFSMLYESSHQTMRDMENDMSIIILDIDHFKRINDTHGHNVGDMVIVELSKALKNNLREIDMVCRWGGEEFVILLPAVNIDNAFLLAHKLQKYIEELNIETVGKITASFGVSAVEADDDLSQAVGKADRALYKAKSSGRNRVVMY